MSNNRLRVQVARRAAQLMYDRDVSEYFTAKRRAARELGLDERSGDLASNSEIREHIQILADLYEGESRLQNLRQMRLDALGLMRKLAAFCPNLIGSTLTGHVRKGSDIDIHAFTDDLSSLTSLLEDEGYQFTVERKRVIKHGEARLFTHIHIDHRFAIEISLYTADKINYPFKSSITGRTIEKANQKRLEGLLRAEYPDLDIDAALQEADALPDVFPLLRQLLMPLEEVKQSRQHHPEGDALYHSLQVFELARQERPWDQEFLLAALLHDVGKAIDPRDHVAAALEALEGLLTPRTAFFIGHHMEAHAYRDGTLGERAKRRLRETEDLEDLLLLQQLDRAGRVPGRPVPSVDQAIEYLRLLESM